ncbi:hypothetical protein TEHAL1_03430 [Tetragenococcus halophilus]|nr:hypothetical protein WJ7_14420 [Tetragenococcus halophilus]GFK28921.1 hypothetical protein YG2_13550 [Tetragenococcus halophilus]GLL51390.1 hypothetical protein YA5_013660 [Tetragenococcus halophilus]GMG60266.1 hypothetical protein TEHAB4_00130 [Tetragenococcus halophilus]GMG62869.1 hypothetical protein TEHAL1_03430 [Tetragenococcus halophilus]
MAIVPKYGEVETDHLLFVPESAKEGAMNRVIVSKFNKEETTSLSFVLK